MAKCGPFLCSKTTDPAAWRPSTGDLNVGSYDVTAESAISCTTGIHSTGLVVASLLAALAVFTLGASACGSSPARSTPSETQSGATESAIVAYVNDGDTLRTTSGSRIRLLQIDAPALHGACFGNAARKALRRLTPPGARITLVGDPDLDSTDRYGRELRYVFRGATNVNLVLVRHGAASPYFYRQERGRYADELLDAAAEARAARRGYWGFCPAAEATAGGRVVTGLP
ncbi:MAG: thermonuclease family protein [Thermoleophilia bacterium]|nr:thermonuclease family protein [Thermoleophilia bacterium]